MAPTDSEAVIIAASDSWTILEMEAVVVIRKKFWGLGRVFRGGLNSTAGYVWGKRDIHWNRR
jgi:hypothetical protein